MKKKRFLHYLEEGLLILLIILNILEFFEFLPADLNYTKKIISWTALGYLLYRASLSYVFFNSKHHTIDILLITAYFMLIFKNIVVFSVSLHGEFFFFKDVQQFLLQYAPMLELYLLFIGSFLILALALYAAKKIPVKRPSLLYIIHEEGGVRSFKHFIVRACAIYIVFLAFFVIVFNLVMEWLAIIIDAPLIMLAMVFYLFIIIRQYRKYKAETLIYRLGELGEQFYEKFISLFHYKKTIFLGISGMLVLHLVTDALSFMVPYLFTFNQTLYFSNLGVGHESLPTLFLEQIQTASTIEIASLFGIYALNMIGLLALLLLPALFWYIAFTKQKVKIPKPVLALISIGIILLATIPVFQILRLQSSDFVGVDIQTHHANLSQYIDAPITLILLLGAIAAAIYISLRHKQWAIRSILLVTLIFFSVYIYLFFTSQFLYYTETIHSVSTISGTGMCAVLIEQGNIGRCAGIFSLIPISEALFDEVSYLLSLHFIVFLIITILFYLTGFIMFIDEIIKEKVFKKLS